MAQEVAYCEKDIFFSEGPFVIMFAYDWRILVESKGDRYPIIPNQSIWRFANDMLNPFESFEFKEDAEELCDWLNEQVELGAIKLNNKNQWVAPRYL